ncbi:hypothetical protein K443DRAFT_332694 [Laccaria amethystina LaAM-08-1]|uniref:Uncharacterized protein n=1 Tax=Laccaria amethystina LaAM-08-1 TaxID=1095629 RepID=A0A0C9X1Q6_9AGAR|nr:hypothetical protein K443DRAFT_332694 [Laccaria amethystina LaAM-08-1]
MGIGSTRFLLQGWGERGRHGSTFWAFDHFEDMSANPDHRQIAGPDGGLGSQNSNHIGKLTYITSGQFQGQTIRVELEELQKAERGRKYYTRWVFSKTGSKPIKPRVHLSTTAQRMGTRRLKKAVLRPFDDPEFRVTGGCGLVTQIPEVSGVELSFRWESTINRV